MELAETLGVSRTVIRDALSNLENAGFVERVRGIGTVINRGIVSIDSRLDLKLEYNDMIAATGHRPVIDSIALRAEKASAAVAEHLHLEPGKEVAVCHKRVLADDRPVIYSIDYIPLELFGRTNYALLDWSEPVFDLLSRCCGLNVLSSIANVSAVSGNDLVSSKLELPPQTPLLLLEEVSFCRMKRPVLYSLGYYTDFFSFTLLRKKF